MTQYRTIASVIILIALGLTSCRTSQQERRSANARNQATTQNGTSRTDSLLMIERKLTEVIDSMTSLVQSDHNRIRALEQQLQELRSQVGGGNSAMPPQSMPQSYDAPPPVPPTPPTPPHEPLGLMPRERLRSAMGPTSFDERYELALDKFHHNDFNGALAEFRRLAVEDPNSGRAPNYLYWQGESLYALKRYDDALQTFEAVMTQYPQSMKAAASQFKIGETYEKMNQNGSAKSAYERLLADYPNSEYRTRAEARVRALRY